MALHLSDVFSTDEVVLRAWTNGATDGIPVLVCNGLGAPAQIWSGLYDDETSGLRIVGFQHRGTGGSGRPSDEGAMRLSDFADDAAAVADSFAMTRAVVVGWSVGVAVAFDLAARFPALVAGVVAVCGVPQPQDGLRRAVARMAEPARSLGLQAARALPTSVLDLVNSVPANASTVALLRIGGLISDKVSVERSEVVLREYLAQDPSWYLQLAQATLSSDEQQPKDVSCPVSFVAGRQDPFVAWTEVEAAARSLAAPATVVPGTHFLPLERPDLVAVQIREMAATTGVAASGSR